jgi:hypothetical protein
MSIRKIIRNVLLEHFKNRRYDNTINWNLVEFRGDDVKCYHYSGEDFDDYITTRGKRGFHSKNEYKVWGRSRVFFYLTESGISYDAGVSSDYKYISYIPKDKIYDINKNPDGYEFSSLEEVYQRTSENGYTAWVYNLGKNPNAPIVVSFVDVKISEKFYNERNY